MSQNVAIIGATGAVGHEMLTTIAQRSFPYKSIRLFASPRSAGTPVPFQGRTLTIEALTDESFNRGSSVDVALFSAGATTSKRFAPLAAAAGATVVDNSSAFRMEIGRAHV